jgi:hypothetical protein
MIRPLLISCALGLMAPVKEATEATKGGGKTAAKAPPASVEIAEELKKALAENAKLQETVQVLTLERETLASQFDTLKQERDEARASLSSSPSLPVSPPSPPAADLPQGIKEEMVREKIAESAGGFTRGHAITILKAHAERAAAVS